MALPFSKGNFAINARYVMKGGNGFMNRKLIKGLGIAASLVGAVATLVANWVSGKEQDAVIAEKVAEAIANAKEGL